MCALIFKFNLISDTIKLFVSREQDLRKNIFYCIVLHVKDDNRSINFGLYTEQEKIEDNSYFGKRLIVSCFVKFS